MEVRVCLLLCALYCAFAQRVQVPDANTPKPPRPATCSAFVDADGSVTVAWQPLPENLVTSYVIMGTREGQPRHAMTSRLPTSTSRYTIRSDQLVAGARYIFQVAPINVHQHGPPSPESAVITVPATVQGSASDPEFPPPGRPEPPHAVMNEDGSMTVSWVPMADKVTSYTVLATREGQPQHAITGRLPKSPTKTRIAADQLVPGASYTFRIAGLNGDTQGPPSGASPVVRTEGVAAFASPFAEQPEEQPKAAAPPKPTGATALSNPDGGVTVSWEALPTGTVTSYVILAIRDEQPQHAITERLPVAPTMTTIPADQLVPGARYQFRVAPINVHTHGPPSEKTNVVTTQLPIEDTSSAAPDKCSPNVAKVNSDGSVTIAWLALPERVTSYVILATRDNQPRHAITTRLPTHPTEATIPADKLVPGSSYTFQVAAINQHTHGPPGPASAAMQIPLIAVQAAKPDRVPAVSAEVDSDGSVTIDWQPLPPGTVTSYVVLATREGQPRHAITGRLPLHPTTTVITANKLVRGMRYKFQVAAINVDTKGPPSPFTTIVHIPEEAAPEIIPMDQDEPTIPPRPEAPHAVLESTGAVTLTWPPIPAGTATSFVVLATREGQPRLAITDRLPADSTSVSIRADQLVKGARYEFQVAAINVNTEGPPSEASNAIIISGHEAQVAPTPFEADGQTATAAMPPRPGPVKATANSDGSVSVSWEALPTGTVTSYVILAIRDEQPQHAITERLPVAPTWTTIPADQLVPGARYQFRVAPINVHTHGPPSERSQVVITQIAAEELSDGAPAPDQCSPNLAKVNSDGSVTIAWLALPERVTSYVILATRDNQPRHAITTRLPTHPTEATIPADKLVPGSSYTFQVAAINQHTHGPPGPASAAMQIPGSSSVKLLASRVAKQGEVEVAQESEGRIKLSWEEVDGAIFYEALYQRQGSPVWTVLKGADHLHDTKFQVTQLQQDERYRFAVEAITADGVSRSPESEWVLCGVAAPGVPTHVRAVLVDKKTMHVEWSRPGGETEKIAGYRVMVYEEGELIGPGEDVTDREGVDVDGLEPETKYTFRVAARNQGGWGSLSLPTREVKTRGRKPRSATVIITWIIVEAILVILIVGAVCLAWRRRRSDDKNKEQSYMELPAQFDDDDLSSFDSKFCIADAADRDPGETLDFQGVLKDINERVHFRVFCESQGFLPHFRLFQTVEDYKRLGMMDRGQRARDIMRQYLNEDGDLYVGLHPLTLGRIIDTIQYGDSTPAADLFNDAQKEATAVLQLLSFPDYLRTRHGIKLPPTPFRGTVQIPRATNDPITAQPVNRAILHMLTIPRDRLRLESVSEEADPEACAALSFVDVVEKFRQMEPEELPKAAHDIVEQFMAGDSGLRVQFSHRVQQELISTERPHAAMFDDAQKEAIARLVGTLIPNGFDLDLTMSPCRSRNMLRSSCTP